MVDPERASHRCHYHHGLAPSPALTPTQHHCNCDPISPHRSSIHSRTLITYYSWQVPKTGYTTILGCRYQVRSANWVSVEHTINQRLMVYQKEEESSLTNLYRLYVLKVEFANYWWNWRFENLARLVKKYFQNMSQ